MSFGHISGPDRSIAAPVRRLVLFLLWIALAVSLGPVIVGGAGGISAGNLLRSAWPALALAVLCLVLSTVDLETIWHGLVRPAAIRPWHVVIVGVSSVGVAFALRGWFATISSVTFVLFGIVVLTGMLASLFLTLSRDNAHGPALGLLVLPMLGMVEHEWRNFGLPKPGPWGPLLVSPTIVFLMILLVTTLLGNYLHGRGWTATSLGKYVFLWMLVLFVSSLASTMPEISFRVFVLEAVVFPTVFFLVVNRARTKDDLLLLAAAAVGYVAMRIALTYYFAEQTQSLEYGGGLVVEATQRAYSSRIASSGILADSALSALPLAVSFLLIGRSAVTRGVFGILIALFVMVQLWANIRSVLLILAASVPLLLLYKGRRNRSIVGLASTAMGVIVAAVFAVSPPVVGQKFAQWTSFSEMLERETMRLDAWPAAFRMMMDHPFFGIGPGMWSEYIGGYAIYRSTNIINSAHQFWLQYGSTAGIGAVLAMLIIFFLVSRLAISSLRSAQDSHVHTLAVGLLWAWATLVLRSLVGMGGLTFQVHRSTDPSATVLENGLVFWLVIALVFAANGIANSSKELPDIERKA